MSRAFGVMTLAAALAWTAGCDRSPNEYSPPPPPAVTVANPVKQEVREYFLYTGTTQASQTAEIRARVQGVLESVHFAPGQAVQVGDLLYKIDSREYEAEVRRAEAVVRAKEASLLGAENDARLARELADKRAGPEIDAIIKAATRDVIEAEVAEAKAALAEAQLNLDYCTISSPIEGRITKSFLDPGNLVGRGEATLLATVVDAQPVYVSVAVSENDVLRFHGQTGRNENPSEYEPGQSSSGEWRPSELAIGDERGFVYSGRVNYVAPELDSETGTLTVRTEYANTNESLFPGLFARVRFPKEAYEALLVPDEALLSDQQGRFAMVVGADDIVQLKRVEIGVLQGSMRVIKSGLTASDRVIVNGVLRARPGSKVTPQTAQPEN
jgi:RND family efflux transporter MFP subunit